MPSSQIKLNSSMKNKLKVCSPYIKNINRDSGQYSSPAKCGTQNLPQPHQNYNKITEQPSFRMPEI